MILNACNPMILREATPIDNAFIEELCRVTNFESMDQYPWVDDEQRDCVLTRSEGARIVQSGGVDIGIFQVVYSPSLVHLSQIRFLPSWQGNGIGTMLIKALQNLCSKTCTSITLHVSKTNRAQGLYRKLGFEAIKADDKNLLMRWTPPSANINVK